MPLLALTVTGSPAALTQDQVPTYPAGPVSLNVYEPALTSWSTSPVPVIPLIVVGPVAVNVQSVTVAVPPLLLVMVLTSFR